jgi:dolichyl-phosphate beta-glucosyltransferase
LSERVALEVIVPAYNEEERLGRTLARIAEYYDSQGYTWRCAVVNDGSKDGTAEIVMGVAAADSRFRLLEYGGNRGKGFAVRYGILRANADRVLFCDADLTTPQE